MDPLHFCIAVAPMAVYLLLVGFLNLRGRPFVTTGARDTAALAIGLAGFMVIGPMTLFFPETAASRFGGWVWAMLFIFYGLSVSLGVLLMRSRIVIYNITTDHLRPILTSVARKIDKTARWNGDSLWMPQQKVHLHMEPVAWLRNVQLTAGGNEQSYEGWQALERELKRALHKTSVRPGLVGIPLVGLAVVLALGAVAWMLYDQPAVAQAWQELMRR